MTESNPVIIHSPEDRGEGPIFDHAGEPQWIERAFNVKPGLDPLGLQTFTIDRIMPRLVPSILGLTRRARYFSFYSYLLSEYESLQLEPSNEGLSQFIKTREYDYALAVLSCPKKCFEQTGGPIGSQRATPAIRSDLDALQRGDSVESRLGGYGLYYRTPMAELGLAVRAGEPLGERSTPVDILFRSSRASALANRFRDALGSTEYGTRYVRSLDPIPRDVLSEYAASMCLCSLDQSPVERLQLREILLGRRADLPPGETDQRRRSFAYILRLLGTTPDIASSESAMRDVIWNSFQEHRREHTAVALTGAQWAALIAKDVMQDGLSSIWKDVCALGLARQSDDGLSPAELDEMLAKELAGLSPLKVADDSIHFAPDIKTSEFVGLVVEASRNHPLETVRQWANGEARAIAGLTLLSILFSRLDEIDDPPAGWIEIASQSSERQPSVNRLRSQFADHMDDDPTVGETLSWIAKTSIIGPHEVIAYSKLPDFTFRFRWENGRLRFYPHGRGRFEVTDIRRDSILMITRDLGYWDFEGVFGELTDEGSDYVREVLG